MVDYDLVKASLMQFDDRLDEVLLCDIAGGQATREGCVLRSLPQSMGGLGMVRFGGLQGIKSNEKSISLTSTFVFKHVPALEGLVQGHVDRILLMGTVPEEAHLVEVDGLPGTVQLGQPEERLAWRELHTELLDQDRRGDAAHLVSASQRGTARWLCAKGGWDYRVQFDAGEYQAALGIRLLMNPFPAAGNDSCRCMNPRIRYAEAPLHALGCQCNQIYRNMRHDQVRDHLLELVKRLDKDADVYKERWLEDGTGGQGKRCDIWYRKAGTVYVIDVSVVEPCSIAHLDKHSDRDEEAAAKVQEKVKQRHYEGCPILEEGGGAVLIPFVVESTGRMGPQARDFFDLVTKEQKLQGSLFLDKMSAALARATGRMICASRKSLALCR